MLLDQSNERTELSAKIPGGLKTFANDCTYIDWKETQGGYLSRSPEWLQDVLLLTWFVHDFVDLFI